MDSGFLPRHNDRRCTRAAGRDVKRPPTKFAGVSAQPCMELGSSYCHACRTKLWRTIFFLIKILAYSAPVSRFEPLTIQSQDDVFFEFVLYGIARIHIAVFIGRNCEGHLFFNKAFGIFFCSCKQIWTPDNTITGQCFFEFCNILSWLICRQIWTPDQASNHRTM